MPWGLDALWHRLHVHTTFTEVALDPASTPATATWLGRRTWIPDLTDGPAAGTPDGAAPVSDDECHQAMGFLHQDAPAVPEAVFWGV